MSQPRLIMFEGPDAAQEEIQEVECMDIFQNSRVEGREPYLGSGGFSSSEPLVERYFWLQI